jgi:2-oxoisovalerate dehydrogenase E1 component
MKINPRPILLEFKTFRMRGHEERSTNMCPQELMDEWAVKDPAENYRAFLKSKDFNRRIYLENEIKKDIDENLA